MSGNITDKNTGETLIGASVIYGKGMGVSTDFDGNFSFLPIMEQEKLQSHMLDINRFQKKLKLMAKHHF